MRSIGGVIATFASGMQFSGLIGSNVRTGLNSTKHGRNILFDAYEVLPAEQDCRPAALSGLHHQDIVEVDQNLPCRRSRSFQCDENGQSGLPFWLSLPRRLDYLIHLRSDLMPQFFTVRIDFYHRENQ